MEFKQEIEVICNDTVDFLLKTRATPEKKEFGQALDAFNNAIVPIIPKAPTDEIGLYDAIKMLLSRISKAIPELSERGTDDTPVVKHEYVKPIALKIMDIAPLFYGNIVRESIIKAAVEHEREYGLLTPSSINRKLPNYYSLERLVFAAREGNIKDLNSLLTEDLDVTYRNNRSLFLAASNGHTEAVRLLVEKGADITHDNYEPLRKSVENGQMETASYLFSLDSKKSMTVLKELTNTSEEVLNELSTHAPYVPKPFTSRKKLVN